MDAGFGFRFSDFGFRTSDFRFRVPSLRFRVSGLEFRVSGFECRGSGVHHVESCHAHLAQLRVAAPAIIEKNIYINLSRLCEPSFTFWKNDLFH